MKKIAFVSGYYTYGGNKGISENNRFMYDCLYKTAKKYFLKSHDVDLIFISNDDIEIDGVNNIKIDYDLVGYDHMLLMKILGINFIEQKYDYIFVSDGDQIFINEVNDDDLLDSNFSFFDHYFKPTIKSILPEISDIVDLNFDTTKEKWTMGNFFGGSQEVMLDLLKHTKVYHEKYLGKEFSTRGFYARYPDEIFLLKYAFENNVPHKRLKCTINPVGSSEQFFLSDFTPDDSQYILFTNTKLIHDTKKDLETLKKIINNYI